MRNSLTTLVDGTHWVPAFTELSLVGEMGIQRLTVSMMIKPRCEL